MSNLNHGTSHPSQYAHPDSNPGPAPLWNSIGGESITPELDKLYSPLTDDSDIATVDAYDPSLQSVPDTDEGDDAV